VLKHKQKQCYSVANCSMIQACGLCVHYSKSSGVRLKVNKVKLSLYRAWKPFGLREFEAPTFSDIRLIGCGKAVSLTRRPLFTPRRIPGVHFWVTFSSIYSSEPLDSFIIVTIPYILFVAWYTRKYNPWGQYLGVDGCNCAQWAYGKWERKILRMVSCTHDYSVYIAFK
jgi:hypothetical protein